MIILAVFTLNTFRFDQPTKEKVLAFILGSAVRLSAFGKVCLLRSVPLQYNYQIVSIHGEMDVVFQVLTIILLHI